MPGLHVNDLKANTGAFARAYMFNIYFDTAPVGAIANRSTSYLVRSTSLPEGSITALEVPWQGQVYKFGSTHEFAEWECTFNVDANADIRKNMIEWQRQIHDPATNIQGVPADYFGEIRVEHLNTNGDPIMIYLLHQAWPSSVATLDLAHDSKEVAQFSVTFTYNWYTTE